MVFQTTNSAIFSKEKNQKCHGKCAPNQPASLRKLSHVNYSVINHKNNKKIKLFIPFLLHNKTISCLHSAFTIAATCSDHLTFVLVVSFPKQWWAKWCLWEECFFAKWITLSNFCSFISTWFGYSKLCLSMVMVLLFRLMPNLFLLQWRPHFLHILSSHR